MSATCDKCNKVLESSSKFGLRLGLAGIVEELGAL